MNAFDYKFYIDIYKLQDVGVSTANDAIIHYFTSGQHQDKITNSSGSKPKFPSDFNWAQYAYLNPDLQPFAQTYPELLMHYINHGQREGRKHKFPYYLSVHMMFQNEETILKEWIEYYLMLGVDHFYLYNHESTDASVSIVKPYVDKGLVTLKNYVGPFTGIFSVIDETINLTRRETKWLAIIDSDEFIVPKKCNSLKEFLVPYEEFAGLGINWQMFGTSGVGSLPKGKTLVETLVMKKKTNGILIKSIVQPARVVGVINQHVCKFVDGFFLVNENKKRLEYDVNNPCVEEAVNLVQINHYYTRTEDFFIKKSERRRRIMNEDMSVSLEAYKTFNEVKDDCILRFVPLLRMILGLETSRTEVINYIIKKRNYKSYLEIGTCDPRLNFDQIVCNSKECVDPAPLSDKITYKMTSDDAFKLIIGAGKKYDLIFIDGLHEKSQVDKDVYHSLMVLNKGGMIVMHDCNPPTKLHSLPPAEFFSNPDNINLTCGAWNGDVYKTVIELRVAQPGLSVYVVDTDWGCGLVFGGSQVLYPRVEDIFSYEYFDKHRKELLNLISVDQFKQLI